MPETNLVQQVESVLFSSGRNVEIEELIKLCKTNKDEIKKALDELKGKYDSRGSALMLVEEGSKYKLTVREQYQNIVKRIVTETELPKTMIETLAVVAWKAPVLQSKVIDIRTNKAYEHLKFLEEAGYITRQKQGRTRMIKLAQKFFDYFDMPKEKLKEKFKKFEDVEKAVIQKEGEIEVIKKVLEKKENIEKDTNHIKVEKGVRQLFENASSEMPKVPKPDELSAKKQSS